MNGFILVLAISFAVLMFVIVPLFIARTIYHDAHKRDIDGALWYALMAFFIPFYLGIVFYIFKVDAIESAQDDKR